MRRRPSLEIIMNPRHAAIHATLADIKRLAPHPEISRATLEQLKATLTPLAQRTDLFPKAEFPIGEGQHGTIYELARDPDGRFALYASAGAAGKFQPPHNHTTWAVISGVFGEEHNVGYERVDDAATPGKGQLSHRWETTCVSGNAVGFLANDFHTIEVRSNESALHLHLYGLSLEELPNRVFFPTVDEALAGGTVKRFMAKPTLHSPYVTAAQLRAMLGDGAELAAVDVRDGGVFALRHLLTTSNIAATRACACPRLAAMRGRSWLPSTQFGQPPGGSTAS